MKGDGRRRRTASEDGDDLNLKRFKGAGNSEAGTQNCGDSNKTPEEVVGIWAGDSERVSSSTKNGSPSEGASPPGSVSSSNTNSSVHFDHSNASSPLYPALVKENGRLFSPQGAADSTSSISHPPNPPPLKPAPSPFSTTSFPSLGQMPVLVPGAPAPKASPSPQPDREDACQSAYSKTAVLVSPGPVTISWSQDSRPSVSLSPSLGFSPKAPTWGGQTEGSKASPGFRLSQGTPTAPVFGDVTSQTNGAPTTTTASHDTARPFGFDFSGAKNETRPQQDQNLFFQCMTQNSGTSPILTTSQTQTKDTNYFTAVSESLSKEPAALFRPAASTEVLKKPEQPKVPEAHPLGNGAFNIPSALQGTSAGGRGPGLTISGLGMTSGAQSAIKNNNNNGTSEGGLVLQSSFNSSDIHQNIFLQASKESANPFLAYGDKNSPTPFVGLTGTEQQTLGVSLDSKPNLFTMAEQPKGILSSTFPAPSAMASVSSSTTPTPAQTLQSEMAVTKNEQEVVEMPTSMSGALMLGSSSSGEMKETALSFDQNQQQKFSLEDRSQSSKRDSDSSTNSDLSDLSENEEGLEKDQIPAGLPHPAKDGSIQQKSKVQVAAKSRPRNKSFKGASY
ncbi:hypothetical protein XENOCAPTIV_012984 [Xenoophorus captivus]|uniref:Uncharacterized protein n=1 Tax=Xenoophorus captivus TaxID=1517983 RepID=A0ABV0RDV7_9TELE